MPQETDSLTATSVENPDLVGAASAVETAGSVVDVAFKHLAADGDIDADQVVAYDLAHAAAAVENARAVLDYGERGDFVMAQDTFRRFAEERIRPVAEEIHRNEAAYDYASERKVFGKPIIEFQLTRAKLARMAMVIQASRQFAYRVARLFLPAMSEGPAHAG